MATTPTTATRSRLTMLALTQASFTALCSLTTTSKTTKHRIQSGRVSRVPWTQRRIKRVVTSWVLLRMESRLTTATAFIKQVLVT